MTKNEILKLLYATPSVSREIGGIFDVERNLALGFNAKSIYVDIISLEDENSGRDLDTWFPLKPQCHKVHCFKRIGYSSTYLPGLMNSEANVGHIHSLWSYTSFALYLWAKKNRRRYVITPNGMLDKWALNNSKWKKKLALCLGLGRVLRNAACIQVNTMHEYNCVREFGLNNPVCLITNGVIIPDLNLKYIAPWEGIENARNKKILLYLSRIHPKKGVDLLLEAWKNVVNEDDRSSDWHLVMVGFKFNNDPYEKSLISYIDENELNNFVSILEGQYGESMYGCYQNCDAYILPSLSEGVPIAALTAWSFEKPSLITAECYLPEGFEAGASIRISPDVHGIQQGVSRILDLSEDELKQLGQKARNLVIEKFSWNTITNQLQEVYEWILNSEKIPSTLIMDNKMTK